MLFPSTLLAYSNQSELEGYQKKFLKTLGHQKIENNPDILLLEDQSISSMRTIREFLSKKPINHQTKIVIINQVEQMHLEAQNAILKLLEEPGDNNYLLITTQKPFRLLPTILSRCHYVKVGKISLGVDDKIDPVSLNKEEVIPYLENQLAILHQQIIKQPSLQTSRQISILIKALSMIDSNIDPKIALDYYLVSLT